MLPIEWVLHFVAKPTGVIAERGKTNMVTITEPHFSREKSTVAASSLLATAQKCDFERVSILQRL